MGTCKSVRCRPCAWVGHLWGARNGREHSPGQTTENCQFVRFHHVPARDLSLVWKPQRQGDPHRRRGVPDHPDGPRPRRRVGEREPGLPKGVPLEAKAQGPHRVQGCDQAAIQRLPPGQTFVRQETTRRRHCRRRSGERPGRCVQQGNVGPGGQIDAEGKVGSAERGQEAVAAAVASAPLYKCINPLTK